MTDTGKIEIVNNIDVSPVLMQQLGAIQNGLNLILQRLETSAPDLASALAAELRLHKQLEDEEPRKYLYGSRIPDTFRSPKGLSYSACRDWVHDLVLWLNARWKIPVHSAWRLLYNDLSDYLGYNVWTNYKSFETLYTGTYLDMIDAKGFMRFLVELAYKNYGDGQPLPIRRYDTEVDGHVDLEPCGERAGQPISMTLKSKKVGKTRKKETKTVKHVSAKVEKFKEAKAQTLQEALAEEFSPQNVASRADAAEAQLNELNQTPRRQPDPEPWQSAQ